MKQKRKYLSVKICTIKLKVLPSSKLKEKRKRVQEQNKKVKEATKQQLKEKALKGMQKGKSETDVMMKKAVHEANAESVNEQDDDKEYYRKEVGEEPDEGKQNVYLSVNVKLTFFFNRFVQSNSERDKATVYRIPRPSEQEIQSKQ